MERETGEEFSSEVGPVAKRQKRYVRNRRLAGIGWLLIILGLSVGITLLSIPLPRAARTPISILKPIPTLSVTVNATSPGPIAEANISTLVIALYAPTDLQVGQPVFFTVKVVDNVGPQGLGPSGTGGYPQESTPIDNGTPKVPLEKALGPGYDVFAFAQLDISPNSNFELTPSKQDSQSLYQGQVIFDWGLDPQEATKAIIHISVIGQWKPIHGGIEQDIPLWRFSQTYVVSPRPQLTSPTTTATLPLTTTVKSTGSEESNPLGGIVSTLGLAGSVVTIFAGLGINVPWILDLRKKRKSKQSTTTNAK